MPKFKKYEKVRVVGKGANSPCVREIALIVWSQMLETYLYRMAGDDPLSVMQMEEELEAI